MLTILLSICSISIFLRIVFSFPLIYARKGFMHDTFILILFSAYTIVPFLETTIITHINLTGQIWYQVKIF